MRILRYLRYLWRKYILGYIVIYSCDMGDVSVCGEFKHYWRKGIFEIVRMWELPHPKEGERDEE